MKRVVPVLEWIVLLPLWRRVFKPRPLQAVFAAATAIAWPLILVAMVSDGGRNEPLAEDVHAVTAGPGAIAEAEHVRVILHQITDPWISDNPFSKPRKAGASLLSM